MLTTVALEYELIDQRAFVALIIVALIIMALANSGVYCLPIGRENGNPG